MNDNQTRREEIRREDRRQFPRFILTIILCGVGGGVLGFLSTPLMEGGGDTLAWLGTVALPTAMPVLMWLTVAATLAYCAPQLRRAQRIWQEGPGDEGEREQAADVHLTRSLTFSSLAQVVLFTCFGINSAGVQTVMVQTEELDHLFLISLGAGILALLVGLAVLISLQRRTVNLVREMSPEKDGSVYQMDFQRLWLRRLDEAELARAHRAGFAAYRVGQGCCLVCWLLAVFGGMFGWMTWGAVLLVGLIWGAMTLTYCLASRDKASAASMSTL